MSTTTWGAASAQKRAARRTELETLLDKVYRTLQAQQVTLCTRISELPVALLGDDADRLALLREFAVELCMDADGCADAATMQNDARALRAELRGRAGEACFAARVACADLLDALAEFQLVMGMLLELEGE